MQPNALPNVDFATVYRQSLSTQVLTKADSYAFDLGERCEQGHVVQGSKLPWSKTHADIGFVAGDLSIWAGSNGSGKSTMLLQACLAFMAQGEAVAVASLEMPVIESLYQLTCQAARCEASREFAGRFLGWAGNRLWFYDRKGKAGTDSILGAILYAAETHGVRHFIIDNLSMLTSADSGDKAFDSQKALIENLKEVADRAQCHIHVVHHVRKADSEDTRPSKFDIKGSGAITDLADQVLLVWRNRKREQHFQNPQSKPNPELEQSPGCLLAVVKNRRVGIEKTYGLWFHRPSRQFCPRSDGSAWGRPFDLTGAL